MAVTLVAARAHAAAPAFIAPPPATGIIVFPLSGQVKDLEFKYNAVQTCLHVHATVSLHNNLDVALDQSIQDSMQRSGARTFLHALSAHTVEAQASVAAVGVVATKAPSYKG
jgi:hypothetical protein